MKVFFEAKVPSYFSAYKLTLVPGENIVPKGLEDDMKALVATHVAECARSKHNVPVPGKPGHFTTAEDKPRLRLVEDKKPASKVGTSAMPSLPKPADAKKGAK
jgi:hypothetical protein